jgi:periplasmic copper chaperone A
MPNKLVCRIAIGAFAALAWMSAAAGQTLVGDITIDDARARATIGSSTQGVIYLTITNAGKTADALIGASTPAAAKVEIHTMEMSDGMMRMRAVEALPIAAGATISLSPGGDHLMLMGVATPLKRGDTIDLTLSFRVAGDAHVKVPVEDAP